MTHTCSNHHRVVLQSEVRRQEPNRDNVHKNMPKQVPQNLEILTIDLPESKLVRMLILVLKQLASHLVSKKKEEHTCVTFVYDL